MCPRRWLLPHIGHNIRLISPPALSVWENNKDDEWSRNINAERAKASRHQTLLLSIHIKLGAIIADTDTAPRLLREDGPLLIVLDTASKMYFET